MDKFEEVIADLRETADDFMVHFAKVNIEEVRQYELILRKTADDIEELLIAKRKLEKKLSELGV